MSQFDSLRWTFTLHSETSTMQSISFLRCESRSSRTEPHSRVRVCPVHPHTLLTCCTGAAHLLAREASLESGLRYVCAVEEVQINGKTLRYIICMLPEQSAILRSGKRMTMDTAFKRVRNWYELELETWDDSSNRCACFSSSSGHYPV